MPQPENPSVSVIIVNWDHGHLLCTCLDALLRQDYAPLDITVVDNGSQDGSPAWVDQLYPRVRLWAFPQNMGFCRALNWGVTHTQGDLVLSLNPDTQVRPGFLQEMVRSMASLEDRGGRVGMVAPKLLCAADPALLDSTGLFVDRCRRPYDRGQGERDAGQYDGLPYCFGACGAAALYRRTMLEDVSVGGEVMDEAFFAYYEDADLAWRAQLRGWRCRYAPRAVATHARGRGDTLRQPGRTAKGAMGPRLALRNRYLMAMKNDTLGHFLADLPRILAAEVPWLAYAAVTRPVVLLGLWDLVQALPAACSKRRQIRSQFSVDVAIIRRWFVAPAEMAAGRGGVDAQGPAALL